MKKLSSGDPLARFLIRKLGFTPIRALMVVIVVAFIYDVLQIMVFGSISPYQDYLQVLTILAWHYVFVPAMGYFYIWSNNALRNLLELLATGDSITLSIEDIGGHIDSVNKSWGL